MKKQSGGVVVKKNTEVYGKNGLEVENMDVKQPISAEHLRFVVGGQEEQDEEKKYNKTDHTDPNKKRGPQL